MPARHNAGQPCVGRIRAGQHPSARRHYRPGGGCAGGGWRGQTPPPHTGGTRPTGHLVDDADRLDDHKQRAIADAQTAGYVCPGDPFDVMA
ncbi:hypothetical protein, partial [Nocardia carnea]|uniref:hypothetical protein n=1 Tax=Nocardia carnea TaxID=37328 RepID=UPI00245739AE